MQALTQMVGRRLETETCINNMNLTIIRLDLHPRFTYTIKRVLKPHGGYAIRGRVVERHG